MLISLVVEYMAVSAFQPQKTGWSASVVSLIFGCAVILIYTGAGAIWQLPTPF